MNLDQPKTEAPCPRAKSYMTPCVFRDGRLALADDRKCVGCDARPDDICPNCGSTEYVTSETQERTAGKFAAPHWRNAAKEIGFAKHMEVEDRVTKTSNVTQINRAKFPRKVD